MEVNFKEKDIETLGKDVAVKNDNSTLADQLVENAGQYRANAKWSRRKIL